MRFHKPEKLGKIKRADNSGAAALIMVVWVMIVLMAIVGEFAYSMRTEINIVRNFKEEEQAYYLAVAGIEQAKLEILSLKQQDVVFLNEEGVLDFTNDEEEELVRKDTMGNGSFEYTITDEDGKLNINTASTDQLKYLFESVGIDITEVDTVVDSIFDWRDVNDLHLLNGAEEDYYQSLPEPYSCKDGPFDTIEELLLVNGMTEEFLYGSKEDEIEDEDAIEGVINYLTVNETDKININTASRIVLETIMGIEAAGNIIMQRETLPITLPQDNGKVSSSFFTIISTGKNADGIIKRTIKAVLSRKGSGLETIYWNDNVI